MKFVNNKTYICSPEVKDSQIKTKSGQNCFLLQEDYLLKDAQTIPQEGRDEFRVENGYFAMGDNRGHTTDSLHCFQYQCFTGANYVVPKNYMIGRVLLRVFPNFNLF